MKGLKTVTSGGFLRHVFLGEMFRVRVTSAYCVSPFFVNEFGRYRNIKTDQENL